MSDKEFFLFQCHITAQTSFFEYFTICFWILNERLTENSLIKIRSQEQEAYEQYTHKPRKKDVHSLLLINYFTICQSSEKHIMLNLSKSFKRTRLFSSLTWNWDFNDNVTIRKFIQPLQRTIYLVGGRFKWRIKTIYFM